MNFIIAMNIYNNSNDFKEKEGLIIIMMKRFAIKYLIYKIKSESRLHKIETLCESKLDLVKKNKFSSFIEKVN